MSNDSDTKSTPAPVFILPDGSEVRELPVRYQDGDTTDTVTAKDAYFAPREERDRVWYEAARRGFEEKLGQPWDFGRLLQSAGTYIRQALSLHVADGAFYSLDEAESFLKRCVEVVARTKNMAQEIADAGEAAYDAYDQVYHKLTVKRDKFKREVEDLGKDIHVPYGLDKLVELAEKFERLSPEAWERVIELARVLKEDERG